MTTTRRSVLVTRPAPGLDATVRAVAALGHRPVAAPMLRIEPLPPSRAINTPPQAILLTSAHAVRGASALAPRAVPVFAVGDATAGRARAAGFDRVESAAGDAASLVALCAARLLPGAGPLVLATASGQGGTLLRALRERGFTVRRRIVYRQVAATALPEAALAMLRGTDERAVLFLSGSASRAFRRALPLTVRPALAGADAFGISAEALRAVSRLPWRRVHVAVRPTHENVLALL